MATAGLGVLAIVAGIAGGIAAMTSDEARIVNAVGREAPVVAVSDAGVPSQPPVGNSGIGAEVTGHAAAARDAHDNRSAPGEADRTGSRATRRTTPTDQRRNADRSVGTVAGGDRSPATPSGPAVRTLRVSETEPIPFRTKLVRDPSLPRGSRRVQTPGMPGERVLHYEVTYTGVRETGRRLLGSTVTRRPQHRVIAFGDRRAHHDSGGQNSGGQNSGGQNSGGRGHGHRGECRLIIESCVRLGRSAVCTDDQAAPAQESIIDGDLSLLDPADLDELDLVLPCEDATTE
jgi:hypothetical protein